MSPIPGEQGARPDFFVAGTDTDVGKTVVSLLMLTALRARGLAVQAMKPVETGCAPWPLDALALAAAAGVDAGGSALAAVCPYRFEIPVAPQAAAEAAGAAIEVPVIRSALERLRRDSQLVLVESAGGLGTPCAPGLLVLDLALALRLPVILVVRDELGTIGQTLMALRAMLHAGVRCVGVILNRTTAGPAGPDQPTNAPLIEAHGQGVPVLGTLPHLSHPPPSPDDPGALRAWARAHVDVLLDQVDLDRLLASLTEC